MFRRLAGDESMAEYTFFFNPMSRSQIARWALHEVGADYEPVLVEWQNKPAALLQANPMGKLPTIIHHHGGHDHVVSEAAAVCHYLAEMSAPELLPREHEKADYFRWLFFAAGPVEMAVTSHYLKFAPTPEQEMAAGWGNFERTMDTLDQWLSGRTYACGERFTMADVYLGSQIMYGTRFGAMPQRESFMRYWERCEQREAYQAASAIDNGLIAEMQAGQPA
jgi:glutathione S-transferase